MTGRRIAAVVLFCLLVAVVGVSSSLDYYSLSVLHTNDVHARFIETNKYGGRCKRPGSRKCFGGMARRKTAIDQLRSKYLNTILVDAGDQFQGTLWFYIHRGIAASNFMNRLGYDAFAIGNHEFDNTVDGLIPFLRNVTFPVLSCNIDVSLEPKLDGLFKKSVVQNIGGRNVGLIGYTTKQTPFLSKPGKVIFEDEVIAVSREARRLTRNGIDIIIAVGHSGIETDKKVAAEVPELDIVVGGHSNTFLYTGQPPSNDKPFDKYPIEINRSGKKVLVVQAYAFGKYLGLLNVKFDNGGNIVDYSGNPILLDYTVSPDGNITDELHGWEGPVNLLMTKEIATTAFSMDGSKKGCRLGECEMGSLITDAMMHYYKARRIEISFAIFNGGGIRRSMPQGGILMADIVESYPYGNSLDLVQIKGKHIPEIFEHAVKEFQADDPSGRFLQVAGVIVRYDTCKQEGSRVVQLELEGDNTTVAFDDETLYAFAAPSYIANGGDGYKMIRRVMSKYYNYEAIDVDVVVEYLTSLPGQRVSRMKRNRILLNCNCTTTGQIRSEETLSGSRRNFVGEATVLSLSLAVLLFGQLNY